MSKIVLHPWLVLAVPGDWSCPWGGSLVPLLGLSTLFLGLLKAQGQVPRVLRGLNCSVLIPKLRNNTLLLLPYSIDENKFQVQLGFKRKGNKSHLLTMNWEGLPAKEPAGWKLRSHPPWEIVCTEIQILLSIFSFLPSLSGRFN